MPAATRRFGFSVNAKLANKFKSQRTWWTETCSCKCTIPCMYDKRAGVKQAGCTASCLTRHHVLRLPIIAHATIDSQSMNMLICAIAVCGNGVSLFHCVSWRWLLYFNGVKGAASTSARSHYVVLCRWLHISIIQIELASLLFRLDHLLWCVNAVLAEGPILLQRNCFLKCVTISFCAFVLWCIMYVSLKICMMMNWEIEVYLKELSENVSAV